MKNDAASGLKFTLAPISILEKVQIVDGEKKRADKMIRGKSSKRTRKCLNKQEI